MAEDKPAAKHDQMYQEEYRPAKCNIRIEELAKPNKNNLKVNYKHFKKFYPERNRKFVATFIQEEFARSPEEIEKEFKKLMRKHVEKKCRKVCRIAARKEFFSDLFQTRRKVMLMVLTEILKRYMLKAFLNPKQIIMNNRLRKISNIVLKAMCSIRKISVPKRESTTLRASLMFVVADFFAFCIDTMFYNLQVQKIRDYERIKQERKMYSEAQKNSEEHSAEKVNPS